MDHFPQNRYAVLTTEIFMDKSIDNTKKVFLALVNSLSSMKGFCFASNSYLADAIMVSERRLQQIIQELESAGYLSRVVEFDPITNEVKSRALYVHENRVDRVKSVSPPPEAHFTPSRSPLHHNIKSNIKSKEEGSLSGVTPTADLVVEFFAQQGYSQEEANRFFHKYQAINWLDSNGAKIENWESFALANWIPNIKSLASKREVREKKGKKQEVRVGLVM